MEPTCPTHGKPMQTVCDEFRCFDCQMAEWAADKHFRGPKGPAVTFVNDGHRMVMIEATPEHPM